MRLSRRRSAQLLLGGLGFAAAGCAGVDTAAPGYRVVDLMPAFWEFWREAQPLPEEARPALFLRRVVSRAPQAYAPSVIGLDPAKPYDVELARRYHRVQSLIAGRMDLMHRLSERIARDLRGYEATFRRTFPDLAYRGDTGVSLFGLPRSTPERVRANLPALARSLGERLDSRAEDDYRRWFLGSDEHGEVPARAGYVLGFMVAQSLARRQRLIDLAHARPSDLRPEIDAALAALALW